MFCCGGERLGKRVLLGYKVLHKSDAEYGGDYKNSEGYMENQKGF